MAEDLQPRTPVLVEGWVFFPDPGHERIRAPEVGRGRWARVAVYTSAPSESHPDTHHAGLFVEGHPDYDPPRRIIGATPMQALELSFRALTRVVEAHPGAFHSPPPPADRG